MSCTADLVSTCATRQRVLLVSADLGLREAMQRWLDAQGFEVRALGSGRQLLQGLERWSADLVLLDLDEPEASGLAACRELRATGHVLPVLMLSASADEIDRVVGLEVGADDYLAKPVSPRELRARLQTLMRRAGSHAGGPGRSVMPGASTLSLGRAVFLPASRSLQLDDGRRRPLGAVEHAVLSELCRQHGRVVSRPRLLDVAGRGGGAVLPRAIDVCIWRLRALIEPDPSEPRHIQTVRGQGYLLVIGQGQAPA